MTIDELIEVYGRRRDEAEHHASQAPLARVYDVVIRDLEQVEVIGPRKMLRTSEVAELLGLAPRTVANKAAAGEFPGAEKTSGDDGEWRIPASAIYEPEKAKARRRREGRRRILDDDD